MQENGTGAPSATSTNPTGNASSSSSSKRDNPHKYLLHRPPAGQLLLFLSSGHRELPAQGALLLFVSGEGCLGTKAEGGAAAVDPAYDLGGVLLSTRREQQQTLDQLASSLAAAAAAGRPLHPLETNW